MVLEKTLESPLDCKIQQSILEEISPEYSLEGLMLKLKPQYFGHLIWRTDSFEKTLMLGMEKDMVTHSSGEFFSLENPRDRRAWWAAIYGVA